MNKIFQKLTPEIIPNPKPIPRSILESAKATASFSDKPIDFTESEMK